MDTVEKDAIPFKSLGDGEFGIYTELADLPVSEYPSYLEEGVGAVCLSGTALIQVFTTQCRILPEMVLVLVPWQLVSVKEASEDFRMLFFRVSKSMFTDSLSSLWRLTPEFFFYMHKHFLSEPVSGNIQRFSHFCTLLSSRMQYAPEKCRRESVMQLLRVLYWDVYACYVNDPLAGKAAKYTRKEELAFRFLRLVIEEHSPNTDVACYAGKLGVSSKYLTTLIKQISGQSAHDWIVEYTILEIKALLRESSMDLKSIATRVNFPDQSSLCRYFRRYAGVSPSQYRKDIFF